MFSTIRSNLKYYVLSDGTLLTEQSAALSSATQRALSKKFDEKRGAEVSCISTMYSLHTMLCAGYSVKLKHKKYIYFKY